MSVESVVSDVATALERDEVRRRIVHAGGSIFPLAYLTGLLTWPQLRVLYVTGLVLAAVIEFLRLVVGMDSWLFRELARDYERTNVAGYALYVLGSTVTVLVFEPRVAVPAVLMLTIVDPVSGLLADNEFREPKRPLVLAVTFGLAGLLAAPFVWPSIVAILLGAAATTLADGFTPVIRGHALDDNLTIPIGASVAMWVGLQLPI